MLLHGACECLRAPLQFDWDGPGSLGFGRRSAEGPRSCLAPDNTARANVLERWARFVVLDQPRWLYGLPKGCLKELASVFTDKRPIWIPTYILPAIGYQMGSR